MLYFPLHLHTPHSAQVSLKQQFYIITANNPVIRDYIFSPELLYTDDTNLEWESQFEEWVQWRFLQDSIL